MKQCCPIYTGHRDQAVLLPVTRRGELGNQETLSLIPRVFASAVSGILPGFSHPDQALVLGMAHSKSILEPHANMDLVTNAWIEDQKKLTDSAASAQPQPSRRYFDLQNLTNNNERRSRKVLAFVKEMGYPALLSYVGMDYRTMSLYLQQLLDDPDPTKPVELNVVAAVAELWRSSQG